MDSVGSVALEIKVLRKELINEAKSAAKEAAKEAQAEVNKASKGFSKSIGSASSALGGLGSVASKVGGILGAAFSVAKIVSFSKACIDLGSDLAEVQNVVDVVYGNMSADVNSFAQSAIKSYGMSETVAKNYMGTLGAMSKAFGFTTQEAYGQAEALTALAGDMASFYNKSTDETFTALKAVYSGETEVLKQYGVVMNETALNEFALSQGISKTVKEMSEQEKVSLRLAFVQDRLSAASGDFQRTSGGWANQVRVLSLQFDSFKASIGQGLINVLTPVVQWLNMIMEAANKAAQAFSNFTASIMGVSNAASGMGGIAAETAAAAEGADDLTSGIESAGGAAKKAMQKLAGFDKINTLNSDSSSGGGGSSASAFSNTLATASATGEVASETSRWKEALEGVIQKAKQIKDAFVEGFNESYGGSKYIDGIKEDIGSIANTAKSIFTDPQVQGAADSCTESWARAFGSISGTVATITLGTTKTVTGTIDKFLTENEEPIRDHLVTMFDLSSREGDAVTSLSGSVSKILQSVFDSGNLESIGANISGVFFDITSVIGELKQSLETGFLEGFAKGIKEFEGDISQALVNISDAVKTFTEPFKEKFDEIRKKFESSGIADKAKEIGKAISSTIGTISKGFNKIYPVIKPVIKALGDFFAKYGAAFFSSLILAFNNILSVLKAVFNVGKGVVEVITGIFTGDWDMISQGFEDIIGAITGLFDDLTNDVANFISDIAAIFNWDEIIAKTQEAWGTVATWFDENVIQPIISFFTPIGETVGGIFDSLWNGIAGIWETVATWFDENVIQPIVDFFTPIEETISGIFNSLWCIIVGIWTVAADWFNDNVIQPVIDFFSPIVETVSTFFSDLWDNICGVWESVSSWFNTNVTQPVTDFFKGVWTNVSDFFSKLWSDVEEVWEIVASWFDENIIQPVTEAFEGLWTSVSGFFSDLWDDIEGIWESVSSWFDTNVTQPVTDFFEGVWTSVSGFFSKLWDDVKGVWESVASWFDDYVVQPISEAFDGLTGTIEGVFNSALGIIEDAINGILDGVNSFIYKLDDFGRKGAELLGTYYSPLPKFSSISIPRLAQGGFVEANTPQLALIGDNKREGEIVAPESKIAQAVAAAMMQVLPYLKGANTMAVAGSSEVRRNITLELDGQILYETVQRYDQKNNSRSGGRA